jgi:general secretion pathway protein C
MLPKSGVEVNKKQNVILKYRRFKISQLLKEEIVKPEPKIEIKKPEYQLLSNIILKAIYNMNEQKGWIIIADKKKNTYMLSVGENYKGYELIRVYVNYVIFKKSNKEYKLELNVGKDINFSVTKIATKKDIKDSVKIVVKDDKVSVKRSYLNSYINDFSKIWKNISIKEIKDTNGNIDGFKITKIKKNSVFAKLGLKKNDIIKSINNIQLKSYNEAFSAYKQINSIDSLNMLILRNSREMELNYEIE